MFLCACSREPEEQESPEPTGYPVETPPPIDISTPPPSATPSSAPTPGPVYNGVNPLNGLPMDESYDARRPLAVMFNNIKEALPLHGISQADLIYEALAEGGVTRIMGFYKKPSDVPRFGSIRSTRAYYLDIAQGHDAILMHAGGSPEALNLISSRKLLTLDGTRMNAPFYRDQERLDKKYSLEHTMFTNGKDLEQTITNLNSRIEYEDGYDPHAAFEFIERSTPGGDAAAKNVRVKFSNYKTTLFDYDASEGLYFVSQFGEPMNDAENGRQVRVKNVLVIYTETKVLDSAGRLYTRMTGTGSGLYICDGKAENIFWSKDGPADPYVYTLTDGAPLKIGRGVSYINIVNAAATVETS